MFFKKRHPVKQDMHHYKSDEHKIFSFFFVDIFDVLNIFDELTILLWNSLFLIYQKLYFVKINLT